MHRLASLACALCLAWAATAAASEHFRFMGRDFPRPDSAAIRARLAASHDLGTPAWTRSGIPVANAPYTQLHPSITEDGNGGVVISWLDFRTPSHEIYAQRLTIDGERAAGWPEAGVALTVSQDNEVGSLIVPDGAGGAFALILIATPAGYFAASLQRVLGDGSLASGWPANGLPIVPPGSLGAGVIPGPANSAYLAWLDSEVQLRMLRFTGEGALAPGWPIAGLAIGPPYDIDQVALAPDAAGGGYIAWVQGADVKVTRVASGGGFATGWLASGRSVTSGHASAADMTIVTLSNGDAMVVWSDDRNPPGLDLYAMRVTAAGGLSPGWPVNGAPVCAKAGDQRLYGMVPDLGGGALVIFDSYDGPFAQRLTSSGGISTGWPDAGLDLCGTLVAKEIGQTVTDGAGGAIVAWSDGISMQPHVHAQRAAASGSIATGWPADGAIVGDIVYPFLPVVASDAANGAIVAWEDYRGSYYQIHAGHVLGDATVPALASLAEAIAEPDRVVLRWYSPDGAAFVADLERAAGDAAFTTIATLHADGLGHAEYEDRDVAPGLTYRYRLAVADNGGTRYLGAVTLRIPEGPRLAVAGFRPNPAAGDLAIAFSLAGRVPARVEVFDLAGRRVIGREVADPAPGERVLSLGDARLDGGIYLIRITQGTRAVTTCGIVLR